MRVYDTAEKLSRVVLAGVHTGSRDVINDCTDESVDELELLAETAGAEVVGHFVQNKAVIEAATYIGEGKAEEIRLFCLNNDVDIVVFDDELTGTQIRNLEDMVGVRVMDRSSLILDIFATRAKTAEGKLQVELAQLRYYLSRLTGSFVKLSRLGGGIGTRGPGETKLETDRRHIRNRISLINEQLSEVEKNRKVQRKKRVKDGVIQIALVGYTNAGKSTLLNKLTDAGVFAEDKLFATLDPTSRRIVLPDGTNAVLTDTVGFIRKLPHHLINAFRSTLEEAAIADMLVHVVDSSSLELKHNITVVEQLLYELKADDKPIITVYNKCDSDSSDTDYIGDALPISAKTGYNLDKLVDMLAERNPQKRTRLKIMVPYNKGGLISRLYDIAHICESEHTADGIKMEIIVDSQGKGLVSDYII